MKFSLLILLYGDFEILARRCLDSIRRTLPASPSTLLSEAQIGGNELSVGSQAVARDFLSWLGAQGVPGRLLLPERNVGKYPLMRRMLYDNPPAPGTLVMWVDDDTFFTAGHAWTAVPQLIREGAALVGQYPWYMPLQGQQWEWIRQQPWYNPGVGEPKKMCRKGRCGRWLTFVQGAWWVARRSLLMGYDWPIPELHHNGGDSMLGELCRHIGAKISPYDRGLAINADEHGQHSRSARRGITQNRVGWTGKPMTDFPHQVFSCVEELFGPGS